MSMTPAELERKVRQLDNDVHSIYEMLNGISTTQQRHTNRLLELAEQVGALEVKMDERFAAVDERLTGVDGRLAGVDGKVDTVLELLRNR